MAVGRWTLSRLTLWSRRLPLAQAWIWAFGMLIFSHSLHAVGLEGMPRRTMISAAPYVQPSGVTTWVAVRILVKSTHSSYIFGINVSVGRDTSSLS
jgi:heme/copper-type cytochrome/quinol oxidase subunit 1